MKLHLTAVIAAALTLTAADLAHENKLQQAIDLMETKGDLPGAIKLFEQVARSKDRRLAARSLLYLGDCRARLGGQQSRSTYERIVREFADQREVAGEARSRLAASGRTQSGPVARRVWAGSNVDDLGTVSPDGRYLSFVDWETGDLAVRDLVAGTDRRLTNKGSWNESDEFAEESTISRDGKQVAYSWFNKDFRYELRVANLSGEPNARRLFDRADIEWIGPYDWSPDGKWIAVQLSRKNNATQIGLISTESATLRVLKALQGAASSELFFSPDGKYLVCDLVQGDNGGNREILLLAIEGSHEFRAVEHPANDVVMGWSPDGSRLLFGSDRTGAYGLWALPIAGGKPNGAPELIKPDIGEPSSMGLSRSGAMFFSVNASLRDLQMASVDFATGKLTSAPVRPVLAYVGTNGWPGFSPNGEFLSYISRRSRGDHNTFLGLRSMATGETREHRLHLRGMYSVRWSRDSRYIVGQARDHSGRQGIYRVDVQTGEQTPMLVSEHGGYVSPHGFSPDGRKLYYRRFDPSKKEELIVERDLVSAVERVLVGGQSLFAGEVSPDGRYVSYRIPDRQAKANVLMVVPVSGGPAQEVLRVKEPEWMSSFVWTPDSRSIVYRASNAAGQTSGLWRVSLDSGQAKKLETDVASIRLLVIHPDGRQVVFQTGENRREIWALENFLPSLQAAR